MTYRKTSAAANREVPRGTQRERVLEALAARGPLTHWGLHLTTGISYKSVTSRVSDLQAEGLVRAGDTVMVGGRAHTLWELGASGTDVRRFGAIFDTVEWTVILDALRESKDLGAVDVADKIEAKLRAQGAMV